MSHQSYLYGRPDELSERATKGRAQQRRYGLPWSPALDALEAFSYQDPASQNQTFANMAQTDATSVLSPWQKYGAVVQARGAQLPWGGAPSSISENPASTWNMNQAGPRPWGDGAQRAPGAQGALGGLQQAMGRKRVR